MQLTAEQRRAYALDLLNNPLLGEILEGMKSDTMTHWAGTSAKDVETREYLWNKFQGLVNVTAGIESAIAEADEAIEAEKATEEGSL
jgi:hypothetical protein